MAGSQTLITILVAAITRVGGEIKTLRSSVGTQIADACTALKNEILGGASAAYDTLKEIEDFLKNNDTVVAALQALKIVKYDAAQELTSEEKGTARSNIGAAAAADLTSLDSAAVKTTVQSLEAAAQAQARTNIGAVAADDIGDFSDLNLVTVFENALADSGSGSGNSGD